MPLAADNPADRAEQLIALTERLTQLVEANSAHLEKRQAKEILNTQDESAKLSNLYAQEMELIKHNKNLLSGIDSGLKEKLKRSTEYFQDKLKEHELLLRRMRSVTEGLIKSVANELAARNETQKGYASDASLAKPRTAGPATLTLNKVI